jgi:hypothetical protein
LEPQQFLTGVSVWRRQDLVVDTLDALEHERGKIDVREVCESKGEEEVHIRDQEGV